MCNTQVSSPPRTQQGTHVTTSSAQPEAVAVVSAADSDGTSEGTGAGAGVDAADTGTGMHP